MVRALLDLISSLIQPSSGSIVVNGEELGHSNKYLLREQIAYVSQKPYFYDDTILNNITLSSKNIDDEKLDMVLSASLLDRLITDLDLGVQTVVGERGSRLSGGQLQRIAIARALYSNCSILILDEATSALDEVTEHDILNSIRTLFPEKLIIMITHRMHTLKFCNLVYKLEDKNNSRYRG